MHLSCYYPGEMEIAIVANGCTPIELQKLRKFQGEAPHLVHLVENWENTRHLAVASAACMRVSSDTKRSSLDTMPGGPLALELLSRWLLPLGDNP